MGQESGNIEANWGSAPGRGSGSFFEALGSLLGRSASTPAPAKQPVVASVTPAPIAAAVPEVAPIAAEHAAREFSTINGLKLGRGHDHKSAREDIQRLLIERRFLAQVNRSGKSNVDGDFGDETIAAIRAFQQTEGLRVTGVIADNDFRALVATHARGLPVAEAGVRPLSELFRGETGDRVVREMAIGVVQWSQQPSLPGKSPSLNIEGYTQPVAVRRASLGNITGWLTPDSTPAGSRPSASVTSIAGNG